MTDSKVCKTASFLKTIEIFSSERDLISKIANFDDTIDLLFASEVKVIEKQAKGPFEGSCD